MNTLLEFEKVPFVEFFESCQEIGMFKFNTEEAREACKEIYDMIKLPKRATVGSAGYDFYSPIDFEISPHNKSVVIPSGIRAKMPEGVVLMMFPRSGHGFKYGAYLENTTGIIDSDYYNADNYGHIKIKMNARLKPKIIKKGEAFCQGIFLPYFVTDDDNADGQRIGGFGSTSK